MVKRPISHARHRFPSEVICHAVWLTLRFILSHRDVEDLLAARGLASTTRPVRRWVLKFGPAVARNLRLARPKSDDRWHLDESVVSITGQRMHLWRAVDSDGPSNYKIFRRAGFYVDKILKGERLTLTGHAIRTRYLSVLAPRSNAKRSCHVHRTGN
jgi:hypothetical protein